LKDMQAAWVDSAFYLAYFFVALPAGWLIGRWGYRVAVVSGLVLFGSGALMFYPAASGMSYPWFLAALFVVGSGITVLETAANPLITQLPGKGSESFRLNLAQSFNGLGAGVAAFLGGFLVFDTTHILPEDQAMQVVPVYVGIGIFVLLVAVVFSRMKLDVAVESGKAGGKPWQFPVFRWAVVSQFLYVGAQIGVGSFFIRYATQVHGWQKQDAAYLLSMALVLFMAGRFLGTALLRRFTPGKLLMIFGSSAAVLMLPVVFSWSVSLYALVVVQFFMSIMFPTIFSLGISDTSHERQWASSLLIMTIAGGAFAPPIMGWVSDHHGIAAAFGIPLFSFVVVATMGFVFKNKEV